jgi:hypothetical protein
MFCTVTLKWRLSRYGNAGLAGMDLVKIVVLTGEIGEVDYHSGLNRDRITNIKAVSK